MFDTIKPDTIAPKPVPKRRKTARIPSADATGIASSLQRMDLNAAPLGTPTDSPAPDTRRRVSRKSSSATALRVSSGSTPTARRVGTKKPLGVDLTFGNSPSTIRHFKRVSSGEKRAALFSNPPVNSFHPNPQARTFRPSPPNSAHPMDMNDENEPPADYPPAPVTKDALYGMRAYSKVLDSVFQEAHADSASPHQREAVSRVAQAWAHLDRVDPHGEFLLLKSMVDRLRADPKLASALGLAASPAPTPPKHNTKLSDNSYSGSTVYGTDTMRIRSNSTATGSCYSSKPSPDAASPAPALGPQRVQTPSSRPASSASSAATPSKGPRLVLAQNNPHLKSHKRRQSALVGGEKMWGADKFGDIDEKRLPGHVEKGMEQQGLLADILYGQWINGLKGRWPLS